MRTLGWLLGVMLSGCSASSAVDAGTQCGEANTNAGFFALGQLAGAVGAATWNSSTSLVGTTFENISQLDLKLEATGPGCAHGVSLFVLAAQVGSIPHRASSSNKQPAFWGLYQGGDYNDRIADGSTLEITSLSDSLVSGRFSAVLEDGRTVENGHFTNVIITGTRRYTP